MKTESGCRDGEVRQSEDGSVRDWQYYLMEQEHDKKESRQVGKGYDFFEKEYQKPEDVAEHMKKGDVVGFCTGTGGDFTLKFRESYIDI